MGSYQNRSTLLLLWNGLPNLNHGHFLPLHALDEIGEIGEMINH